MSSRDEPYKDGRAKRRALEAWRKKAVAHPFFGGQLTTFEATLRPSATSKLIRSGDLATVSVWLEGTRYNYTVEVNK